MSSNKRAKKQPQSDTEKKEKRKPRAKQFRNEKLYKRINLSFSSFSLSVSAISLMLALLISSLIMTNWQKSNFSRFSEELYSEMISQSYQISELSPEDRAEAFFSRCVLPLSDKKMEVGVAIIDSYGLHSNVYSYSELIPPLISQFELKTYAYSEDQSVQRFTFEHRRYLFMSTRIVIDSQPYTIVTFQDDSETTSYILWLSFVIIGAFSIITLISLIFGKLVTRRALAPLKGIAESVKTISEENLSVQIEAQGEDEVDSLIVALNNMLTRLNSSFEMQKQFVSDVSHELRIPLTILQGNLDIIESWGGSDPEVMRESLDSMAEEIKDMRDLIERLLFLHNVSAGNFTYNPIATDLNIAAEKLAADTRSLTKSHKIELRLSDKAVTVKADRLLLALSVRAITDNAIKYTDEGGMITISTKSEKNANTISIADNGCGIPEADIEKVMDRFYRVDSARSKHTGGSGLGLSIVKANVEAMGGTLRINSRQNIGTTVTIELPKYSGEENERNERNERNKKQ